MEIGIDGGGIKKRYIKDGDGSGGEKKRRYIKGGDLGGGIVIKGLKKRIEMFNFALQITNLSLLVAIIFALKKI